MKCAWLIVCLAISALPAWAARLPDVKAVPADAQAFVSFGRCMAVDCVAPDDMALAPTKSAYANDMESRRYGALERTERSAGITIGYEHLPELAGAGLTGFVPDNTRCDTVKPVGEVLSCTPIMTGTFQSIDENILRYGGLREAPKQSVDPFLALFDIWNEGELGKMRVSALNALTRGDHATYQEHATRYWAGVAMATERRQAHAVESNDTVRGAHYSRRNR